MRRRELLGTLCLGGLGMSSGCLSTVVNSTRCSLVGRVGLNITNYRFSSETVRVVIETPVLGRDVFDKTFDVLAATDGPGSRFHPESVCEPDVASSLHSYKVTIHYGESKTFAYSWQNTCKDLQIGIRGEDHPVPGVSTLGPQCHTREREPTAYQ